ncbi:MAG: hypothetical protein JW849_00545 [Phycisphaerae bacterium]|nr:hypothetical protein [Phycisphaerae bacterium]
MRGVTVRMYGSVLVLALLAGTALAQPKTIAVTVTGMGLTEDEAIKNGKKKAAEEVFVKVYSESQTKDFELVKNTILTRSAGFIQSYEVLSKQVTADDAYEVKMKVVVLQDPLDDLWGVVTNLMKDMGRPRIMVYLREKVDGKWEDTSTVETRVVRSLKEAGFALVEQSQIQAIEKKELDAAVAEDNPSKVQFLAQKFGAPIFITGVATAEGGKKTIYGMEKWYYEGDANIKIYRSDTGEIMQALPGKSTPGVQRTARAAAKQALDSQGQYAAPILTQDVLRFWMDVLGGRGEVQLKVEGIDYGQTSELEDALKTVEGVSDVTSDFGSDNATFSIECDTNAKNLAKKIYAAMKDKLKIKNVSQNVIQAEYVKE